MSDTAIVRAREGSESARRFTRIAVQVGIALAVLGLSGLADPLFLLPLAGLVLTIAALTWIAATEVLDDPSDAAPDPVELDADEAGSLEPEVDETGSLDPEPEPEPEVAALPEVAEPEVVAVAEPEVDEVAEPEPEPQPEVAEPGDEPSPIAPGIGSVASHVTRTFRLPTAVGAERVALVGDLNDWSRTSHPMSRVGEHFEVTVELEPGRTYRYRYLLDGERWENDWAADAYVANDHGTDDSLAVT